MQIASLSALLLVLFQTNAVTPGAPVPRFEYSASLGCGDVFFHARNSAKTEVLRIEVDVARVRSSAAEQVFDLAALPTGVMVDITLYRYPQINRPNCDDVVVTEVGAPPNPPEVWLPVGGRLEIERGPRGVRPEEPWLFKATIRLLGARFRGPNGRLVSMSKPFTWEGFVGWQAG
jgi:hypothetical protein